MGSRTIEEAETEYNDACEAERVASERVRRAQWDWARLVDEQDGMPTELGYYIDAQGNIARRTVDGWDDGWGNGGPGYNPPSPPLIRLIPVTDIRQ